jgi:SAM-dependent methyltransferase
VLIAGCGSGHQLALTRQLLTGVRIVGLDLSRRALGYAFRRLESKGDQSATIDLLHGDIMDLSPERIQPFEMICCGGVLHHLPEPPAGLKALRSVLKKGGVLQLATYRCAFEARFAHVIPTRSFTRVPLLQTSLTR